VVGRLVKGIVGQNVNSDSGWKWLLQPVHGGRVEILNFQGKWCVKWLQNSARKKEAVVSAGSR
jgi:hypothetical protein